MSVCNFFIPIPGEPAETLNKAKAAIEKQDGHFTGDDESGNFDVTVMGNTIAGSYTSDGKELAIIIDTKPFFIPCEMVESFLKTKLA